MKSKSCKQFAVLCCCLFSVSVLAAEWSIEPSVGVHEEYNDNIRFTANPHPKVWQTSIRPNLKFSSKTEISEVSGQMQLGINRYSGDASLDQTDQLLLLFASRIAERNTWSLSASYRRDTTSELATTGLVQPRVQRSALTISPSWTHAMSQRVSLRLDYQYQDVKYDSATSTDYTYKQAGAALQYALSERDQLSLSAQYSKVIYTPVSTEVIICGVCVPPTRLITESSSDTTSRGIQFDVTHLFSEAMTGYFSIGRRYVRTTRNSNQTLMTASAYYFNDAVTSNTNTNSLSAKLEKQFSAGAVSGLFSRDVNPSGSGLVNTNRYAFSARKSLTENLTAYLDTSIYRTTYVNVGSTGSRYYVFEPHLSRQLSEWWMLDGGYRYAKVKYDDATNPITANAIYINIIYSWPKISISR